LGKWLIPVIIGVFIFLLGIGFVIWGHREEDRYYESLTTRFDLREFLSHWPPRPEPGALKTGGWIAIIVGIATAGIGIIIYLLNK
jgi:uncharacterized membrane protein YczE